MPQTKIIYSLQVKKSTIDGKGAFALETIKPRKKIGDLGGEIISTREARRLVREVKRIALVEFGNGKALNASLNSNELRYVNHSCTPNTYMRVCYNRVEFYCLRPIKKYEELTCNYGPTHHDGKLQCKCGSENCKGFI
jgi:SET domain-containing protein